MCESFRALIIITHNTTLLIKNVCLGIISAALEHWKYAVFMVCVEAGEERLGYKHRIRIFTMGSKWVAK